MAGRPKIKKENHAFSLMEAMVAIGVISIVGLGISNLTTTAMKATKSSEIRLDLQDIRRTLTSKISCAKTMAPYGPSIPVTCSGNLDLKDSTNMSIIPNSGKLGNWTITARCEVLGSKNGLSVYATMKDSAGNFKKDPLNSNILLDESSPVSLLFKPEVRPCSNFFDTDDVAVSCPSGEMLTGLRKSGAPICVSMPSPPGTLCGSIFWQEDDWGGAAWPCGNIQAIQTCNGYDLSKGMAALCASGNYASASCPAGYTVRQMAYSWGSNGGINFKYKQATCAKD